jgi:hypothetical protein
LLSDSALIKPPVPPPDIWPTGLQWRRLPGEPVVLITRFPDAGVYHPGLIARLLMLADDPRFGQRVMRSTGGTKIYHIERWGCSEATLINRRALAFFQLVRQSADAAVDLSWASLYRAGDYSMPHSHPRAEASIVYCVDGGDRSSDDPLDGQFCFVDPRYTTCCQIEAQCMTHPIAPKLTAGTMIMFPGQMVHCVNPYTGQRPRITLSWNINRTPLPGSPFDILPTKAG